MAIRCSKFALALLALGATSGLAAQGRPILTVPRQNTPSPPPAELLNQPLTLEQTRALYGPRGMIRPGAYNIMWQGGCMTPGSFDRHSFGPLFVTIEGCYIVNEPRLAPTQYVMALPSPDGGMSMRLYPTTTDIPEGACLTVARAVLFGAPRFDEVRCDGNGAADQRFSFLATGPGGEFDIRPWRESAYEADCMTVRPGDAAQLQKTDMVLQPCGGQNQHFIVRYMGPPSSRTNQAAMQALLQSQGWFLGNDGYRRLSPAVGVDLAGSELRSIPSGPNGARACASLCLADNACRAFTWHPGSFKLRSLKAPKCVLKSDYGQPINIGGEGNNRTTSGIVRPAA